MTGTGSRAALLEDDSSGIGRAGSRSADAALTSVRGQRDDPPSVLAAERALAELCPGWRARRRDHDGRWRARRRGNVYLRHGSPRVYVVTAPDALTLLVLIEHQSLLDIAEQHAGWKAGYTAADGWWAAWDRDGEADGPPPRPAVCAPTATALVAVLAGLCPVRPSAACPGGPISR